jgi:hypothetical protein
MFLPSDEVLSNPEIDVRPVIGPVADQVPTSVVAVADVGVTAVLLEHPFAAVEHLPMQAVQAHAIIKPPICDKTTVWINPGLEVKASARWWTS